MPITPACNLDLQETTPDVALPLSQVGVHGVRIGLLLADGTPAGQPCTAHVELSVDLAGSRRGAHMSRFHESLEAALEAGAADGRSPVDAAALVLGAARQAVSAQGAGVGTVRLVAQAAMVDVAPASGRPTRLPVDVEATAVAWADGAARLLVGATVAGMNACPCAQQLVAELAADRLAEAGFDTAEIERVLAAMPVATHNQRGTARLVAGVEVPPGEAGDELRAAMPDAFALAAVAREAMGARVHDLLKRPDELAVVAAAHARPRFVEDCVREALAGALDGLALGDDTWLWARQDNHESIHAHDVHAAHGGTVRELRAQRLAGAGAGTQARVNRDVRDGEAAVEAPSGGPAAWLAAPRPR